ncbi:chitin-binding lectin 1 [Capsicum annuum]|uniref:chitin-binding lectin 1 n=1 Tax=Capsicum annuum TaxID=4072 RepID=UPI001FB15F3C|nr:chitin-binding lectin 1 [Capsicum annuum]
MRLHLIAIHKMRGSSALVSLLSLVLLFLLEVSANPSHPIHLPANETILGQLELAEGEGQCGKQGDGKECPSEECCSYWGWYGTGPAYCASETCQSQCQEPEEPGLCGIQGGGKKCPSGQCCTVFGLCTAASDMCEHFCQSQCPTTLKKNSMRGIQSFFINAL